MVSEEVMKISLEFVVVAVECELCGEAWSVKGMFVWERWWRRWVVVWESFGIRGNGCGGGVVIVVKMEWKVRLWSLVMRRVWLWGWRDGRWNWEGDLRNDDDVWRKPMRGTKWSYRTQGFWVCSDAGCYLWVDSTKLAILICQIIDSNITFILTMWVFQPKKKKIQITWEMARAL